MSFTYRSNYAYISHSDNCSFGSVVSVSCSGMTDRERECVCMDQVLCSIGLGQILNIKNIFRILKKSWNWPQHAGS